MNTKKTGRQSKTPSDLFTYHEALREARDKLDVLEGFLLETPTGTFISVVIVKNKFPQYEQGQTLTQKEWDDVLGKRIRVFY